MVKNTIDDLLQIESSPISILEQLQNMHNPDIDDLLNQTDVLIDGPFLIEKKDLTLQFRGSSNQRIIDMQKTRESGQIVLIEY